MKVRCIDNYGHDWLTIGKIYDAEIDDDGYRFIDDTGDAVFINLENSSLGNFYEVKQMTKSDLVPGKHVVEYRDGQKLIFISNGFVNSDGSGSSNISNYEDNLLHKFLIHYSIDAVYEVNYTDRINLEVIIEQATEVWRRESPEQTEYNKLMEQIEELKAQAEKLKP